MINKKGLEFGFGWMFAIAVGAIIIFLAIYAATKFVDTSRSTIDSESAKQLGILLTPVETNLESAKSSSISFPTETRMYNACDNVGNFGTQKISIASKSGIGKEWSSPGIPSSFYNKYMFSSSTLEGKSVNVFVKPLNLPYKIADLTFIWSNNEKFCFVNAPDTIKKEFEDLSIKNINFTSSTKECKSGKKVCFSSSGISECEIEIDLSAKSVKKNGQAIYYADDEQNALLYGAIFSDSGIYECQVKRLMKRAAALALVYKSKSESLSPKGCSSNLESELFNFANQTISLKSSSQLNGIEMSASELSGRNNLLSCKLF